MSGIEARASLADDDVLKGYPLPVWASLAEVRGRLLDAHTSLLAVTGSLATGTWITGWSDVDVLLVRDECPADWLRHRLAGLRATPEAHVSVFTEAEVHDRAIPPRIVNALRDLSADGRGLLFARPGLRLPIFTLAEGAAASRTELPMTLLLLRRQVATGAPDIRSLYKLLLLAMRIVLRDHGVECDTGDEVIAAFDATFSGVLPAVPLLADVGLVRCRPPNLVERLQACAGALLDHLSRSGVRPGGPVRRDD